MAKPKEVALDNSIGKRVRYIGLGNSKFVCRWCSRSFSRGMISEYQDERFCNEDCIKAYLKFGKDS